MTMTAPNARLAPPPLRPPLSVLLLALAHMACGQVGAPLAPLRLTPQAPTDLTVLQRGQTLRLGCRVPTVSVDGLRLPVLHVDFVWLADKGNLLKAGQRETRQAAPGELLTTTLPTLPEPGTVLRFTALARANKHRSKPATTVTHTVQPAPAAPTDLTATRLADGAHLAWAHPDSPPPLFRVYRRPAGVEEELALWTAPVAALELDDRAPGFAGAVCYRVRAALAPEAVVESAEAAEACLDAAAPVPPPVPQGVAVVTTGSDATVSWSPTLDIPIAGYRVYRATDGAAPVKVGDVQTPETTFRDAGVPTGVPLSYTVTTLGRDGLESEHSAPATTRLRDQ
jgi:hypothetical protein